MLLETLEEKRKRTSLHRKRLLRIISKSPFWLRPAEPKKRPLIIDKLCLMELGLNETQAEILLALWEAGGRLPIWGEGTEDLCHELKTTSSTIRKHLEKLKELGFVKVSFNGKIEIVIAKSPKEAFETIKKTLQTRFQILSELFELKQKEFKEKAGKYEESIPTKYKLTIKANRNLKELKKSGKMVCGFVVGKIENNGKHIIVENFIPIETRSGPKIHFNPVWKEYHRAKRELIKNKKWIIGEFHTHINCSSELHEKDLEKMKMLSRGMWWIVSEDRNVCYFFCKNNEKLSLTEIKEG